MSVYMHIYMYVYVYVYVYVCPYAYVYIYIYIFVYIYIYSSPVIAMRFLKSLRAPETFPASRHDLMETGRLPAFSIDLRSGCSGDPQHGIV